MKLSRNGNTIGVLQSGFSIEDFCLAMNQVDQENDIFEISASGGDGVSDRILAGYSETNKGLRAA